MTQATYLELDPPASAGAGPVTELQRIHSLDVLRGFAVLGILVMNIQSFAMIGAAYVNPTAYGDLTGANYHVWLISHVAADMKFMAIFSMLFGAGINLMTSRQLAATGRSSGPHYRRMAWLLVFGLLHAYLLWYGDILVSYALCGMIAYLFRRWRPASLLLIGLLIVGIGSLINAFFQWSMPRWPTEVINNFEQSWRPTGDALTAEMEAYRGGWLRQMSHRAPTALFFETFLFLVAFLWRALGLMLVGMALFKLDVFSARRSSALYGAFIIAGVAIGIPVILYGVRVCEDSGWDVRVGFFYAKQFNYWGSLLVSLGWVGVIMLLFRHRILPPITQALGAVGRMAFTNYILQTVICTLIFYGHGLALFGKVPRTGQIAIVFAIFLFQLVASTLWLRKFRFGPLEWVWRSLTYGHRAPFRRVPAPSLA